MQRVRAVIIREGKIVLIKRIKPDTTYWVFPGGGVEMEEGPEAAVVREAYEETGLKVLPGKVIFERDFRFSGLNEPEHHEKYFLCEVAGGELGKGTGPEYQDGTGYVGEHIPEWVPLSSLPSLEVHPGEVKEYILKILNP